MQTHGERAFERLNLPKAIFEGYVTLCEYTKVYYEHTKATYNEVYHDGQAVALMRCNETSGKHAEYQPNTRSRDRVAFNLGWSNHARPWTHGPSNYLPNGGFST